MRDLNTQCKLEALKTRRSTIEVRIEGARSRNAERIQCGYALAYTDSHFCEMSNDLTEIADAIEDLIKEQEQWEIY